MATENTGDTESTHWIVDALLPLLVVRWCAFFAQSATAAATAADQPNFGQQHFANCWSSTCTCTSQLLELTHSLSSALSFLLFWSITVVCVCSGLRPQQQSPRQTRHFNLHNKAGPPRRIYVQADQGNAQLQCMRQINQRQINNLKFKYVFYRTATVCSCHSDHFKVAVEIIQLTSKKPHLFDSFCFVSCFIHYNYYKNKAFYKVFVMCFCFDLQWLHTCSLFY